MRLGSRLQTEERCCPGKHAGIGSRGPPIAHRHEAKVAHGNLRNRSIVIVDTGMVGTQVGLTVEQEPSLPLANADEDCGSRTGCLRDRCKIARAIETRFRAGCTRMRRGMLGAKVHRRRTRSRSVR
jgi:hypothetical protein